MFSDARSKNVILVSHCILNQNSISDGTADFPGTNERVLKLLMDAGVGIIQMPCPELLCLGLDRGDIRGGEREVVVENTRIRGNLNKSESMKIINDLVNQVLFQIEEYLKNGFSVPGIVGVNRSPSCGVNTTSKDNREVDGQGVFMGELCRVLKDKGINIDMVGIKGAEMEKGIEEIRGLLHKA